MARFVSFSGDTVWWNVDLFSTIGIGYGKYGLRDKDFYPDKIPTEILGFRNEQPGNKLNRETIILFTGGTEQDCENVLQLYHELIKDAPTIPDKMWLEAPHESYDSNLFHKIELVKKQENDWHNYVLGTEYEILGRYIDPQNSEWTDKTDNWDDWYGSELLACSQLYGECEMIVEGCDHFITIPTKLGGLVIS